MNTMSPGRIPIPHMMRAWALAMARQSAWLMPKAVGRPVVPEVPWMCQTSPSGTQR